MASEEPGILDTFFSSHTFTCQSKPVSVQPDELVHVFGAQEPVRDQRDGRARALLQIGWLTIEHIAVAMPPGDREQLVSDIQEAARAWLEHPANQENDARAQVQWLITKTRRHESKQQIIQRVWLAVVLYNLGHRQITFDDAGQIHSDKGRTSRIGLAPDTALEHIWEAGEHTLYVTSFRQPDGTILRGKGRHRWYVYRVTLNPRVAELFKMHPVPVSEKIALIVASETYATQPQLPRDFYGGDAFQQACIDAQDQAFSHILVLSPQHGVISLDDVVPTDQPWDDVMKHRLWEWQVTANSRLSRHLFGTLPAGVSPDLNIEWWPWLHPESRYEFTVFGGGFPIRLLLDYLSRASARSPESWPHITLAEQRPGYMIDDFEDVWSANEPLGFLDDELDEQVLSQDLELLLEWATELAERIVIYVHPLDETWELAPDEALLPTRILADSGLEMEDFLDLLTDTTLVLEQRLPLSMLLNANTIVSILLQICHNMVHRELDMIQEVLGLFPEYTLRQYVEKTLQESSEEDQLCNCLTLAEQMHLIALAVPTSIAEQLLIWMQTYIAARMRQRLVDTSENR